MQKSLLSFIVTTSVVLFPQTVSAKVFTDKAQCYIQIHDKSLDPSKTPTKTFGTATSKVSQNDACKEAKRVATQKASRGTYPRHCFCDSEKNGRK